MSRPAHSPPPPADAVVPDIAAVLRGCADHLRHLGDTGAALEVTLGKSLCDCGQISADSITSLQRLDYLVQALQDLGAVLGDLSEGVAWNAEAAPAIASARSSASLDDSRRLLTGRAGTGHAGGQACEPDIWG